MYIIYMICWDSSVSETIFSIKLFSDRPKKLSRSLCSHWLPKWGSFAVLPANLIRSMMTLLLSRLCPRTFFQLQVKPMAKFQLPIPHLICQDSSIASRKLLAATPARLPRCVNSLKTQIQKVDEAYDQCTSAWTKGEAEGFFTEVSLKFNSVRTQSHWMEHVLKV